MLGAAVAEALGDRAGIVRFGDATRARWTKSVATAIVDVGGRPYAVIDLPFRGERAGDADAPARRARPRGLRPDGRGDAPRPRHGPQRPPPGRGRVQGARPGAPRRHRARSASARAWPRRRARRDRTGRATPRPRFAVVDYGAGNLVSIDQALTRVGADGHDRPRPGRPGRRGRARRPGRRCGRRRRWSGWPRRASSSRSATGSPPAGRSSGSASGSSSCSTAATRTARRRSASSPAGPTRLVDAPTLPHIGWNQVERRPRRIRCSPGSSPTPTSTSSTRTPARRPAPDAGGSILARTDPRRVRSSSAIARDNVLGVQFHPERSGADGLRLLANVVELRSAAGGLDDAAAGSRSPPDAPPPGDPVPRRRQRPGRQGHPVRRPRRRGRPARAGRALRRRGRRRARLPRHLGRAGGPRDAPRHRRADGAPGVHPADGRRRRPERRRHARRPPGGRRQGLAEHRGGRRSRR